MAPSKCKTVAKSASKIFGGSKRKAEAAVKEAPELEESEEEEEEQVVAAKKSKVTQKTSKKEAKGQVDEEEEDDEEEDGDDEEEEEEAEELSKEQVATQKKQQEKEQEKEFVAKREKELKSMAVADLKELVEGMELQTGKKDDMIKSVLKHEAKQRAEVREKEAQIRVAVEQKKEEFEAMGIPELKKFCTLAGSSGSMSKPERVEKLLTHWLHADGVTKALQDKAHEERESELAALDKGALRKLCDKAGIDPFLKDVLIDRIVRHESSKGKFLKPSVATASEAASDPKTTTKKPSMVEALLAKERENEEAAKRQAAEAEAVSKRIKDLKSKSTDDLKKLLKRKGLENSGKKDEMVHALYEAMVEEEALVARKAELKSMEKDALTKLLSTQGLETSGSKEKMVEAIIAYEANIRQELNSFEAKITEASKQMKTNLEKHSGVQLKDACTEKGLAVSGSNDDKIGRLVDAAQKDGELDEVVVSMNRDARRHALSTMEKLALVKLCDSYDIDALVKEVMVERVLSHEAESGEPVAKKARK